MRYPTRVGRLVLAASHFRPEGHHDEIRNPALWATSTRMPTAADFQQMQEAYRAVAPDPDHFEAFAAKTQPAINEFTGWTDAELTAIASPTLVIIGDHDFVRIEHAQALSELIPDAQLAVLPGTTHMGLMRRADLLVPMLTRFLDPGADLA